MTLLLDRDTARATGDPGGNAPSGHGGDKRSDIQVLRALAVSLVVLYHFWPHRLSGGFIGVDVFFVVSGFLITSHLLAEHRRRGRVSLPQFWARRARRLLPASFLVLAVTAVGVVTALPQSLWQQSFRQIIAATIYVQNWALAADSVDYLAAEDAPSPVQHFWSLSAEEQFYVVVPLILVGAALVRGRKAMLGALAVVAAASLAYSVHLTSTAPGPAYFVTPTRAWEFAAGGLLAFAPAVAGRHRLRAALAWVGWLAIAVTALVYSSRTPFPGYEAALPVLATLAVIGGASPDVAWAPDRLLVNRASVFLGDISYSVYLWHWPAFVFAGTVLGKRFTWPVKVLVIEGAILLAAVTWKYVENPVRRHRSWAARRAWLTFAAVATAMAVIVVPLLTGSTILAHAAAQEVAAAEAAAAHAASCFGATYRTEHCAGVTFDHLTPAPAAAKQDKSDGYKNGCHVNNVDPKLRACLHGSPTARFRIAVVGDSHARALTPALIRVAAKHGWSLTTYTKAACPASTEPRHNPDAEIQQSCTAWNHQLQDESQHVKPYDLVVVSHFAPGDRDYRSPQAAIDGFRRSWRMFTDRGSQVIVIHDVPRASSGTTACLEANEQHPDECVRPESRAVGQDLMVEAAKGEKNVHVIDLTEQFCWDGTCKSAIGGVVVYQDEHHLTHTFSATLAPALDAKLRALHLF